jgi:hypothetical protein
MRGFHKIDVHIRVHKNRTAYGSNSDRFILYAKLLDSLAYQAMNYPVRAAGTAMALNAFPHF